jgi:hypothetical protein
MRKIVLVGVACLIVGVLIGWFSGRFMLERYWTQPLVLKRLAAADVERSTGVGADPVPPLSSVVLRPAPLALSRIALADVTRNDPLVMTLGDVGTGDETSQLNLDLVNRGKCTIRAYSGVAYGYDAYGVPSRMNKGGEHFVAFSEKLERGVEPSQRHSFSMPLKHHDTASLVLAQVDRVECADGSRWARN